MKHGKKNKDDKKKAGKKKTKSGMTNIKKIIFSGKIINIPLKKRTII